MKKLSIWLFLSVVATYAVAAETRLHFIDDDYAKARIEAKQRKVPLFVDVWAPW